MGGQEYDSDDSNSDRGGIPIEGVIFLLDDLLYQFDAQDYFDDDETELNYPYRVESIAATYVSPVEEILSSRLNIAGFVRAIYVNFGPMGYYELDPNARGITEPTVFEAQLSDLFKTGKITNPDNGQVIWRMITNFSSILSSLPANNQILGCIYRDNDRSGERTYYRDYIRDASYEQTCVFVVGEIGTQIEDHIDDLVGVPGPDIDATQCLRWIISAMEEKWGW
ncbi:uncharacterized protein LOC109807195 isoform X1 [Cajanus cajan]|uniref:uncharacterized protein LOC109807195 isoform X1 n=1 Tax=Cajanus cajan TaxID=3821 RepID=UPI00098DAEB9|nr:uncharacterized protein LOC109807195 isoform X1 [Cajanus cajan]